MVPMDTSTPTGAPGSILVFGAGCIGRGLLGELAARSGIPLVFVESDTAFAGALADAGSYTVRLVGRAETTTTVSRYRVLTPSEPDAIARELAGCRFAATAVGGRNLRAVARLLAPALAHRTSPLTLLTCENWPHADSELWQLLAGLGVTPDRVTCAPCSVERMVQRLPGTLDLIGESVETAYTPARVELPGLHHCDSFDAIYARKLYTNNAGHALLAYEGHLDGCETLCQALEIPVIRTHLTELLDASSRMLAAEYGLPLDELRAHAETLANRRFANQALADRIDRVARQPLRKLGPDERLVGLLRKLQRHDLPIKPVCRVIAAACFYFDPSDPESVELRAMMARGGAGKVLWEVCHIHPRDESWIPCLNGAMYIKRLKETQ